MRLYCDRHRADALRGECPRCIQEERDRLKCDLAAAEGYGNGLYELSKSNRDRAETAERELERLRKKVVDHFEGHEHTLEEGIDRLIQENNSGFRDYQDMKIGKANAERELEEAREALRTVHWELARRVCMTGHEALDLVIMLRDQWSEFPAVRAAVERKD